MKKKVAASVLAIFFSLAWQGALSATWKELFDQADSLSLQQDFDSALVLADQALQLVEEEYGEEDTTVALILHFMGIFNYDKGNYDEAESFYKRALAIREKTLGPEHADVGRTLNNLANTYRMQGKYPQAAALLKRVVPIWEEAFGPGHSYVGVSLANFADLSRVQGKYADAESLYKKSLTIFENSLGPKDFRVAYSLTYLAVLCWEQARYPEAESLHKRALEIREKAYGPEHLDVARSVNNLANVYYGLGKLAHAQSLYERARSICQKTLEPNHPLSVTVAGNLANVYSDQEKNAEAESLYKGSLATEEKVLGPEHPEVALSLDNLADHYLGQKRYSEAESLYRRSLAIREKALGPEHPYLAYSLNGLANSCRKRGRYTEAEQLYQRTLTIRERRLGPEHPEVALALEGYGSLCRLRKDNKSALAMSRRASEIRLNNFGDNSYVLCEKDALTYSQQLQASASNYLSCYLDASSNEARLAKKTGDVVLASKGQVSDEIFERGRSLVTETDSATLALAESLRYTKFQLSNLFVEGPDEDVRPYRSKLDSLGHVADELESSLARRSTSFRKRQDYKSVSVDRIASLLPENSLLVEYLKYDYFQLKPDSTIAHYLVAVLNCDGGGLVTDLGEASVIDPLISDYREHVLRISKLDHMPLEKDREEYQMIARKLYKAVIQPVRNHMADKELVLIAPDGGLNLISFAGLIDDEGRYLIEKFPIHYLSSGRDLIRLKDRQTSGQGLLALGDPDYDATAEARLAAPGPSVYAAVVDENRYRTRNLRSGCGDLSQLHVEPLPHSGKEIELVAQQWAGAGPDSAVIFLGPRASEDHLKAEARGKRVVHLATHGYFLEGRCNPEVAHRGFELDREFVGENPLLLSGLLFAGSNLHGIGADSAGVEDGVLSAYEVSAMNLEGTDLVVLSACETGLGEVKQGEGVYGLRRAFQMAGARTVVSALWPVSDKTTADMMTQLYAHSKKSLPEQIRDIQLVQIRKLRSEGFADHPYNWAAFIAMGDWR